MLYVSGSHNSNRSLTPVARTRIKYCGFTRREDVHQACLLGVDALGFVLCNQSPRAVTVDQLEQLVENLAPFVSRVGLLVNPTSTLVDQIISRNLVDVLQFHGNETVEFCQSFQFPFIKALQVQSVEMLSEQLQEFSCANGLLLDTHDPKLWGGTGRAFDWSLWPKRVTSPLILAGGLTFKNVGRAITKLSPYAVDVSGGIESADKGVKDSILMQQFVREVNRVDQSKS